MQSKAEIKVLLVDDEKHFAKTLSQRLQNRGFVTETAFDGNEALKFIYKNEPDVLLLDLKMPGLEGMKLLHLVKDKYPGIKTIILSGHATATNQKEASKIGAFDFLAKPSDVGKLTERIRAAFAEKNRQELLYSYHQFIPLLKNHLDNTGIILGKNALGIKCFCRDDNQDQLGYLLMSSTGRSKGWFDLNSFGAYPAGRSHESFGPASHHIPQLGNSPWTVIYHATHVGCDSQYTFGMTERYGMWEPSSSCGLLAEILSRHEDRQKGFKPPFFLDYEMRETETALIPYLGEIADRPYPMAAAAEILFDLGRAVFDSLLKFYNCKSLYIGGINVDHDAEHPENNFFVPKTICVYEDGVKKELTLQ